MCRIFAQGRTTGFWQEQKRTTTRVFPGLEPRLYFSLWWTYSRKIKTFCVSHKWWPCQWRNWRLLKAQIDDDWPDWLGFAGIQSNPKFPEFPSIARGFSGRVSGNHRVRVTCPRTRWTITPFRAVNDRWTCPHAQSSRWLRKRKRAEQC